MKKLEKLVDFYREVNGHSGQKQLLKGKEIIVDRGVFSPNISTTKVMLEYLENNPKIVQEKIVADCRCGCGILGISAALNGAKEVFFTDSSPFARINTEKNLKKIGLFKRVEIVEADLLEDVPSALDVIIFSNLLIPGEAKKGEWLEEGLFNDKHLLDKFFFQAMTFLKPDGKIFIPFNREIGDINGPAITCKTRRLQPQITHREETPEGEIIIYEFNHF